MRERERSYAKALSRWNRRWSQHRRGNRCKVKEQGFDMLKGEQYIWELTECVEKKLRSIAECDSDDISI